MINRLKNWLTGIPAPRRWFLREARHAREGDQGPIGLRRFEAADTNRLNAARWQGATGNPINLDLQERLETLWARVDYEAHNNPMLQGVIETHLCDVVGPEGPTLQVESDDERFERSLIELWTEFWADPDINGVMSGVDILRLWLRQQWTRGEILTQLVSNRDRERRGMIPLQLHVLDPRRLKNPHDRLGDPNLILGVERSSTGKPMAYWIDQRDPNDLLGLPTPRRVRAEDVLHRFFVVEAGQARGVPLAAASLEVVSNLRAYDDAVLEAAKQAAKFGVVLWSNHADLRVAAVQEEIEIEGGVMTTAPPGYQPTQIDPKQPSTEYVTYREERHRELGRAVGMPLMMVRLDSSGHNYSSARFDSQVYQRSVAAHRAWFARQLMRPLLNQIVTDQRLARRLQVPRQWKARWVWPKFAHVDPVKEPMGDTEGLLNGTRTLQDVNPDWEAVLVQRAREMSRARELGVPWLPIAQLRESLLQQMIAEIAGTTPESGNGRAATNGRHFHAMA